MSTILEKDAYSVNHIYALFVLCIFTTLVVSHFGFEGGHGTLFLIAQDPGHC